jgi:hypothetical protein
MLSGSEIAFRRRYGLDFVGHRRLFSEPAGTGIDGFQIGLTDIFAQRLAHELGAGAMLGAADALELHSHFRRQRDGKSRGGACHAHETH